MTDTAMHDDCVARSKQWLSDLMNLMSVMSFGAFRGRVNSREVNSGERSFSCDGLSIMRLDQSIRLLAGWLPELCEWRARHQTPDTGQETPHQQQAHSSSRPVLQCCSAVR
jgi:hypothetical protein